MKMEATRTDLGKASASVSVVVEDGRIPRAEPNAWMGERVPFSVPDFGPWEGSGVITQRLSVPGYTVHWFYPRGRKVDVDPMRAWVEENHEEIVAAVRMYFDKQDAEEAARRDERALRESESLLKAWASDQLCKGIKKAKEAQEERVELEARLKDLDAAASRAARDSLRVRAKLTEEDRLEVCKGCFRSDAETMRYYMPSVEKLQEILSAAVETVSPTWVQFSGVHFGEEI